METLRTKIERLATAKERATLKGSEIAKLVKVSRTSREKFDIEVVSFNAIEGGVEVFARVWGKDGKQKGFGVDGTVDIERFRIFNPPILVPDPSGDMITSQTDKITGELKISYYREDLQEAVIQVIEHNLSVMRNVHTDVKIIKGKIGNTTSTFYPSLDGHISADPASPYVSWATLHDGLDADARTQANDTGTTLQCFIRKLQNDADPWVTHTRAMILFDTSALPDTDNITSAIFSLYGQNNYSVGGGFTPSASYGLVSSAPASDTALVKGDYLYTRFGTTDFATRIAHTSMSTVAYNDWTLNASGLAHISKTGLTRFGLRIGSDIDNSEPTGTGDTYRGMDFYASEQTGTTQDPKLVVEHTASVSVTVSGTVQTATFSIPAHSVAIGALAEPPAQVLTFSIPAYDVLTPDAHVSPSAQVATFSIPAITIYAEQFITVEPSSQVITFSIPSYTTVAERSVTIEVEVSILTFSIPDPTRRGRIWGEKYPDSSDTWSNKHVASAGGWGNKY